MATIAYSTLQTAGLRLDAMIENEVRALLHDSASIRNSGALLLLGMWLESVLMPSLYVMPVLTDTKR